MEVFAEQHSEYRLDPSHERSHTAADSAKVEVFDLLVALRNARLMKVTTHEHLFFAAMGSGAVELTALGHHYWRLVKENRLLTRLGVTGHQSIPRRVRDFVAQAMTIEIEEASHDGFLWGISSLADGADQMFAELVLKAGGQLHVIVPCEHYETTFDEAGVARYEALLTAVTKLERLPFDEPSERAFFAAGRRVVALCERLVAVWDGRPSRGLGGTADIVRYAQSSGKHVSIMWPAGIGR